MKLSEKTCKNRQNNKTKQKNIKYSSKHIINNISAKIWQKTQKVNEKFGESSGKFGE